ncbi:uncharacterized protein LOC111070248 [Drosophila obscura]|uniref:uncharacterized protein LOC111070248 n=1 Tax=Drosophila obscura TaxID=7282 RepID=UPI000B9FEEF3|nr:uncharacterized protein LOC111070248 [Drosophila obscura]
MHRTLLSIFLAALFLACAGVRGNHLKRFSRSLLFPPTSPTRVQFIGGIGIPVEGLHFESVTSGYVLKAEYFLPTNATEITRVYLKPQAITGREDEFNYGALYRWIIYRGIEMVIANAGLPGRSCLLRLICEHAALPLNHESGLLGEMLDIILTPSSSRDELAHSSNRDYHASERFGRRGGDCEAFYARECQKTPMDLISMLLEVN